MTRNQKIASGCGCALLVAAACAIGVYVWAQSAMGELREEGRVVMAEAEEFGRGRPSSACMDEAFSRLDACDGVMCEATTGAWLEACLCASTRPTGFCDGVPPESEIMASARYRIAACRARGARDEQACGRLLASVQRVCAEP